MISILLIRDRRTGWITSYGEEVEADEYTEEVSLQCTKEEFEQTAKADAGLGPDEPLGDMYVVDEPEGAAFGSPGGDAKGKQGKRIGNKRVMAYAPGNPVTELMQELGKNERQSVSWSDLQRIMELINGER